MKKEEREDAGVRSPSDSFLLLSHVTRHRTNGVGGRSWRVLPRHRDASDDDDDDSDDEDVDNHDAFLETAPKEHSQTGIRSRFV